MHTFIKSFKEIHILTSYWTHLLLLWFMNVYRADGPDQPLHKPMPNAGVMHLNPDFMEIC